MPEALLVLDTGSPVVSAAVGAQGACLAARAARLERSSTQLLGLLDETLAAAGLRLAELAGVVALRGPGSFTGLRIGLATALGFHQALGLPATAVSTFAALAAAAGSSGGADRGAVLAVVDALRGEWSAQLFATGDPDRPEPAVRLASADLPRLLPAGPATVAGFGVAALAAAFAARADVRLVEAGPLAAATACWLTRGPLDWQPNLLTQPLYSRPPAVTGPRPAEA